MELMTKAVIRWSNIQDSSVWGLDCGVAEVPFEVGSAEIRALIQGDDFYTLESSDCCVVFGPLSSPHHSQSSRWFIPKNYRD